MPSDKSQRQQVFEQCVADCADSVYRVAYRLSGNRTLASELVQETYLHAWKNIDSLRDQNKMRAFIFAILRNQYSKLVRKERKAVGTLGDLENITPDVNADPTKTAGNDISDIESVVQQAIQILDEKHRLPILLVSMEGLSVDQAASALNLPRGTVLSRLHRGRKKIKQFLLKSGIHFGASNQKYSSDENK